MPFVWLHIFEPSRPMSFSYAFMWPLTLLAIAGARFVGFAPLSALFVLASVTLLGCDSKLDQSKDLAEIETVLNDWHVAASNADEERYLGHMTDDGVFMGTDATERWSTSEFREFVHPHFARGNGWNYKSKDRHVIFSKEGATAWFDERLINEKYGELRGTGVLTKIGNKWKIAHYNMSFPLPNNLTPQIVEMIKQKD
jgi:ketosteroid isomerase-like protein